MAMQLFLVMLAMGSRFHNNGNFGYVMGGKKQEGVHHIPASVPARSGDISAASEMSVGGLSAHVDTAVEVERVTSYYDTGALTIVSKSY